MIPAIGLMVAMLGVSLCLYIIMRSVATLEESDSGGVRFFAYVTAAVALLSIFGVVLMAIDLTISAVPPG